MRVLAIIPARGGSKGIPRKNVRNLGGKPLIFYSINNAINSKYITDVIVTSEDEEILGLAKNFGSLVHIRPSHLADDKSTLDPVIFDCLLYTENHLKKKFDFVITMQPTSPLLTSISIDNAILRLANNEDLDSIISGINDTHLTWRKENGVFEPNYEKRVNRQYLTPTYRESGGFLLTKRICVTETNRIGNNVEIFELDGPEKIDIDTPEDWNICEYYLKRKKIVFVVIGNSQIGLGHAANVLSIVNGIMEHDVEFICPKGNDLAFDLLKERNYKVQLLNDEVLLEVILSSNPDIVINDCLDTTQDYVLSLKEKGILVVNFEDIGPGSIHADLLINAMYENSNSEANQHYGLKYFCLREEFLHLPEYTISQEVEKVILAFGGVDPENLTLHTLEAIYDYCVSHKIIITVILGLGYKKQGTLSKFSELEIIQNTNQISNIMLSADIAFTSGGRTTFELACIGIPTIVLCQNERELTHLFCSNENGFINLGLGKNNSKEVILTQFDSLCIDVSKRKRNNVKLKSFNLSKGKNEVLKLLRESINKYFYEK